jgi:hypothetical protein
MAVPGHRPDRLGDNDEMASDQSKAPSPLRWTLMLLLDGARPSGTPGWVSLVAPVVTQAAAGVGHWQSGQALLASGWWRGALGMEAPTAAEVQENFRQQMDLMRKPDTQARLPPGRKHSQPAGYRGTSAGPNLFPR